MGSSILTMSLARAFVRVSRAVAAITRHVTGVATILV
jgi:hypothetical protein